jgi:uncharacterized protein (DUF4415 family)
MKHDNGKRPPKLVVRLDDGTMLRRLEDGTYEPIEADDAIEGVEIAHYEQRRSRKKSVTLRMDEDLLGGFKAQGKGWQTLMHSVLRAYYERHLRA